MKCLAAVAAVVLIAPYAIGAPADILTLSAPKVGAEAPKAQAIPDGDVSVATATGALQYSYPIGVPPGRLGVQPQLALSYSSQAPLYGGVAAGWTLSGLPDIRFDGSRGLKVHDRLQDTSDLRDFHYYVSGLAGGRPLVLVTEPSGPNVDLVARAQNDPTYSRYERMDATQPFTWRVLAPDGTTHLFGETARITGWTSYHALARAPLTTTRDAFGNEIHYEWTLDPERGAYRLDRIAYGANVSAGLPNFAEVRFTYVTPTECPIGTIVGAQEDNKLLVKFTDGASKLSQITAIAFDPNNGNLVQHTRDIILEYDQGAESCGPGATHAPYRQLKSITERAGGNNVVGNAPLVSLPPIEFTYGDASVGLTGTVPPDSWPQDPVETAMSYNLSWGYRSLEWPSIQTMMLDLDADGRPDRLSSIQLTRPEGTRCGIAWQRNVVDLDGSISFEPMPDIELPTLPWKDGNGPSDLGQPVALDGEWCALNYQRTQRSVPENPFPELGPTGGFLVYRFLDTDSDGKPDLVTAIHSNHLTYDPNGPGEAPFGAWPSCSPDLPACRSLDPECLDGAYSCGEFDCGIIDEAQFDACVHAAPRDSCDLVLYLDECSTPGCMAGYCLEQIAVGNWDPDCWNMGSGGGGSPSITAHKRCEQFVWEIWPNLGRGLLSTTPVFKLQPLPLESYAGDSSMGALAMAASSHGISDLDADGFSDAYVRGGWLEEPPDQQAPYWWTLFPGDGEGGFIRDPVSGEHVVKLITGPAGAYVNADGGELIGNIGSNNPPPDRRAWGVGQLAELNGDGLPDYVLRVPTLNAVYGYDRGLWNFEGIPSPLAGSSEISGTYFTTDPFAYIPAQTKILAGDRTTTTRRIDLDFDHRDDVYTCPQGSFPCSSPVYFNAGGNFLAQSSALGANTANGIGQPVDATDDTFGGLRWETEGDLTDLDGDGQFESVYWTPDNVMHRFRRPLGATPPRLLSAVKNGRGLTTTIVYAPLANPDVVNNDPFDSPSATASPRTEWVVRSVTSCDAFDPGNPAVCGPTDPGDSTTSYFYKYPWFGADDEGRFAFRGFQEVTATGPRGSQTVSRYGFDVDWSGRLVATIVKPSETTVHTIAETTWEPKLLFGSSITTYQPTLSRNWTCHEGAATEAACKADPAGFTKSATTWSALSSTTGSSPQLLYAPIEKTLQDSELFDDGDRKTTTSFALHADATNYRQRDLATDSWVRVGAVDTRFRHKHNTWDAAYKQLELETIQLDAAGTELATTQREYEPTGNVANIRKPRQYAASGPKRKLTYDAKKLFVIRVVDELDHDSETDWDYGTGVKVSERGQNVSTCDPCPEPGLPMRDERRTTIDGLGRPLEVKVTVPYYPGNPSGQTYAYSLVETFSYVDAAIPAAAPTVPANVVHKQRILHDETRWTEIKTELDGVGRPIRSTEKVNGTAPADAVTEYDYDVDGKLVAVEVPDPTTNNSDQVRFTYEFDTLGRATGMRRPDSTDPNQQSGIDIEYDGLIETRREVAGAAGGAAARTDLESDAFGRLTMVREYTNTTPLAEEFAETVYSFSPADEVKTIVDPEGVTTALDHDVGGRRTAITRGARSWIYQYDRNGNMTSEQSPAPSGQEANYITSFVFDDLDRLTSKLIAPRGMLQPDRDLFGAASVNYVWDQALYNRMGRLVYFNTKDTAGNNVFNGRYFYDVEGNITGDDRTWHVGGLTIPERGEAYRYGAFGRITSAMNADSWGTGEGQSSTRTLYDDRGNPLKLQLIRPTLANQFVAVQKRNVAGLVTERNTPASGAQTMYIESEWTYDKLGRVTSQKIQKGPDPSPTQIARQDLTYGGTDDPKTLKHWIGASNLKDFSFTYDLRHQLTDATEATAAFTGHYEFGGAGRFAHAEVIPTELPGREVRPRDVDYVYSASDPEQVSQLTIASGPNLGTPYATYTYDEAGNQLSRTYYTDASLPEPQLLPELERETWAFVYDGEDQLRRATAPDGTVEEYWYDHNGQRALIRTTPGPAGGVVVIRWFHKNTEVELDGLGALVKTWAYASMGTPVARIENRNDRTELQFHGLGQSLLATVQTGVGDNAGSSGVTNAAFDYSPFGEVLETSGTETSLHLRRYSGKQSDRSTGLHYYGIRYLDTTLMTWTQADPTYRFAPDAAWSSPRRANLYTFVLSNPVKYTDPDGRDTAPPEAVTRNAAVSLAAATANASGGGPFASAMAMSAARKLTKMHEQHNFYFAEGGTAESEGLGFVLGTVMPGAGAADEIWDTIENKGNAGLRPPRGPKIPKFGPRSPVSAARGIAKKVPKEFKQRYMCSQFAGSFKSGLAKAGVPGTHIRIDYGHGLTPYSNKFGALGATGPDAKTGAQFHEAVQVGDKIFDNMRPQGVSVSEFNKDMGLDEITKSGAAAVTRTPI